MNIISGGVEVFYLRDDWVSYALKDYDQDGVKDKKDGIGFKNKKKRIPGIEYSFFNHQLIRLMIYFMPQPYKL